MNTVAHEFYRDFWHPAALVVSQMERFGVRLDSGMCAVKEAEVRDRREVLEVALRDWSGQDLGWGSPKQLSQFLYGTTVSPAIQGGEPIIPLGLDVPPINGSLRAVKGTKPGETPTSEAAIHYLADHAPSLDIRQGLRTLLDWRAYRRLEGFYASLPKHADVDGRIHCQLFPSTETGRLASKNPNMQQLPGDKQGVSQEVREAFQAFRACIIPAPGHVLIALDYDGLEWRILAHVLAYRYDDQSLVDEIKAGLDPHSATAVRMDLCPGPVELVKELYKAVRDIAKILNYSINYGKTAYGLGIQLRDENGDPMGKEYGQRQLDGFYRARPGVSRFHDDIVEYAKLRGYVRSLLGRYRYLDFGRNRNGAARQAKNVIQNCAADVMTVAMTRCNAEPISGLQPNERLHKLGVRQLLNVHDELLFEVPEQHAEEAKEILAHEMANALEGVREFHCPLSVSGGIGSNWSEAK